MIELQEAADTMRGVGLFARPPIDHTTQDDVSSLRDESTAADWASAIDQIVELCRLQDGWDGDGAPAPSRPLLAITMRIATGLRSSGCLPPSRAVVTLDGSIILEWQWRGVLAEFEIASPNRGELTVHRKGAATRHEHLSW